MPQPLTPEQKVQRVFDHLLEDDVLFPLLNWTIATAIRTTPDVESLTKEELESLYEKLGDLAKTGAPVFK